MLVLVAVLLALIPAAAILYGLLRGVARAEPSEDEGSTHAELTRRWDSALAGLKNTELERAIGNLAQEDYRSLRQQYMTEAALVMKAMELEEEQVQELESTISREVRQVRLRVLGPDDDTAPITCAGCGVESEPGHQSCPGCGRPLSAGDPKSQGETGPFREAVGE